MVSSPKYLSSITTNCCGFMPAYAYYGAPGSGKGTQGLLVAERERFMHLSAGDLLRRKIQEGDPAAVAVKEQMINGELVDDSLVQGLIRGELIALMDANPDAKGIVLDGFPRNLSQARTLIDMLTELSICFVGMLNLDVAEEEIFRRLLERAEIEHRADDNEVSIRKRIAEWRHNYEDLKAFFSAEFRFYNVDGLGDREEVYERIVKAMRCTCRKLVSLSK